MESVTVKLREMGVEVDIEDNSITVTSDKKYRSTDIKTNPYPGFPTDMHPPFAAVLSLAMGISTINEGVWGQRFKYAEELKKMGAEIDVVENSAHISGVPSLHGATVKAADLRAGACLVIAALAAEGETRIQGTELIERGYQDLTGKLKALGADIREE
jgi:UDP-N-acetylglucosamine 1-carboxyvinyltransferase